MADKKNRKWIHSTLFIAMACMLAGCMPPGPRALLDGQEQIEAGQYTDAIESLKVATSLLATNAQAWNYLGLAYHHAGQSSNAIPAYQQALRLDHDLTEAHFNLGCLWLEQNKLDQAKIEFNAVTLRRANYVDGWLKLGETQSRARDLAGAEKSFNEAIRMNPQQAEAFNGLGMIALQRNHPRDAVQQFNAALKAQPDYAPAILNLAVVEQAYLNDRQTALQKYREYLALTPPPANAEAVSATVRALEQQLAPPVRSNGTNVMAQAVPRNEAAKPATNVVATAVTPKPEAPATPKPAPAVHTMVSQPVDRATMRPLTKTEPIPSPTAPAIITSSNEPVVVNAPPPEKRGFFERINPLNVFHARDEQARTVTPLPPEKHTSNVTPLPPLTNTPMTATPAKPVAVMTGTSSTVRYKYHSPKPVAGDRAAAEQPFAKGLQAHRAGKYAEAVQDYTQAVQADPTYFEAQYNLGLASAAAGNPGQALLAYENCLALRPDSVDARYNFALVLKRMNYFTDAAQELEKIMVDNPQEVRAHLAAGNIYAEQLHQPAQAREHYSKVLELDPKNAQATAIRFWLVSNPP